MFLKLDLHKFVFRFSNHKLEYSSDWQNLHINRQLLDIEEDIIWLNYIQKLKD